MVKSYNQPRDSARILPLYFKSAGLTAVYQSMEKVLLKFKVNTNIQHKNWRSCLNMAAVMRREIISPNLMEPNQLLIMHERNIRSLLGSREEKIEKTTLSRHSYRLILLVFGCSLRLAMNHERT